MSIVVYLVLWAAIGGLCGLLVVTGSRAQKLGPPYLKAAVKHLIGIVFVVLLAGLLGEIEKRWSVPNFYVGIGLFVMLISFLMLVWRKKLKAPGSE